MEIKKSLIVGAIDFWFSQGAFAGEERDIPMPNRNRNIHTANIREFAEDAEKNTGGAL